MPGPPPVTSARGVWSWRRGWFIFGRRSSTPFRSVRSSCAKSPSNRFSAINAKYGGLYEDIDGFFGYKHACVAIGFLDILQDAVGDAGYLVNRDGEFIEIMEKGAVFLREEFAGRR